MAQRYRRMNSQCTNRIFPSGRYFLIRYFLIGLLISMLTPTHTAMSQSKYSIAIHGGAGEMPALESREGRLAELNRTLDLGLTLLSQGKCSLDVVETVIQHLEDCELFNAGRGCVLNEQGEYELDASIMDGQTLKCGAVAGVKTARHPISLARLVMSNTKHVLLSGPGADQFGRDMNVTQAGPEHFVTEQQRQRYLRWKKTSSSRKVSPNNLAIDETRETLQFSKEVSTDEATYYGTVGCVVLDSHGNLAAGTSTGGLLGKPWGRVGDSPIIGAGNYAENATCAVSGTGIGEEFIRYSVASDIAARMRYAGKNLDVACRESLSRLPDDCGGVICVDRHGHVLAQHNTQAMSYALADSSGLRIVQLFPESTKPLESGKCE